MLIRRCRVGPDRASVLMLVPAGFLVLIALGAIAVDLSVVFLRQREATSLALDLANDLAGVGIDQPRFRVEGVVELRGEDDLEAIARDWAEQRLDPADLVELNVEVDPATTAVQVTVVVRVPYVFAAALPGSRDSTEVTGTASARAVPR